MRNWMLPPSLLCRKHLMGEHVECHMAMASLKNGRSVKGFIIKGLLEPQNLCSRHDELAKEINRRGYKHNSALVESVSDAPVGKVFIFKSMIDLLNRCPDCSKRFSILDTGGQND